MVIPVFLCGHDADDDGGYANEAAESELRLNTDSLRAQQDATARIALPIEMTELNQALAPIEIKAIEEVNKRTDAIHSQATQDKNVRA